MTIPACLDSDLWDSTSNLHRLVIDDIPSQHQEYHLLSSSIKAQIEAVGLIRLLTHSVVFESVGKCLIVSMI